MNNELLARVAHLEMRLTSQENRLIKLEKQLIDAQRATSCKDDHMNIILKHIDKMNSAIATKV